MLTSQSLGQEVDVSALICGESLHHAVERCAITSLGELFLSIALKSLGIEGSLEVVQSRGRS